MSKTEQDLNYTTFDEDANMPKKIEFHFTSGERPLVLDLSVLDVKFTTGSNFVFANKNFDQDPRNLLKAIEKLSPNDSIYIETELNKEANTELENNLMFEDHLRVYLTQRSKISYVRVSY